MGLDWSAAMMTGGNVLTQIVYWAGYALFAAILGAGCYVFYYYNTFKIRMTYWNVYGNGQDSYSVDKPNKVRLKFSKDRTSWQMPMKKKTIEPFDSKYMYPGNNVYAFKYGDNYLPAKMNFNESNKNIEPVPYYVKNWHLIELKQNEIEFAKKDFWTQNKTMIVTLCVALGCLAACSVTVYYCLKTASGAGAELQGVRSSLSNLAMNLQKMGAPR